MEQKNLEETVYSAESSLGGPGAMLRRMFQDLGRSRELAWRLLTRDLSARYRQSVLGFAWALISPLFAAGALTLAARARLVNVGDIPIPYPAFILLGMVLWQTFTEALNAPTLAMLGAKGLLARVKFPYEALILAKLGEAAFDFLIKLALLAGAFLWFGVPVGWSTFTLAPLVLLDLVLLGLFLGLLLLPLALLVEDISRGLGFATVIWFCVTPVAYTDPGGGVLSWIVRLNPVTPLLSAARGLALGQAAAPAPEFWIVTAIAALGTLAAWAGFRLAMPFVIERVSH